jgi:hypothetical protein
MEDGYLLRKEQIDKIRHIPCTIVQGRCTSSLRARRGGIDSRIDDLVCPYFTAYELKRAWPEATFVEVAKCVSLLAGTDADRLQRWTFRHGARTGSRFVRSFSLLTTTLISLQSERYRRLQAFWTACA